MFIGHFAIAFMLHYFFPEVPLWVPLVGVSFPDLLWPVLVLLNVEKSQFSKDSPLQKNIQFTYYPYSHSLILSTAISAVIGGIIAIIFHNYYVLIVFPIASASHWLLDILMHRKDLPVLGFSKRDVKVGLGLWNHGKIAFIFEYLFYAVFSFVFLPRSLMIGFLILGLVFHLANSNTFIGFTKSNPFASSRYVYPFITLAGFGLFIIFALI